MKLTVCTFAVCSVLYAAPLLTAGQRAALRGSDVVDLPFFLFVLLACLVGLRRIDSPTERRFWILLASAYASWLAGVLISVFFGATSRLVLYYMVQETLYATLYTILVLAVAAQPHLPSRAPATNPTLSWLVIAALVFGLFAYFVLIPVLLHVELYESGYPSGVLYLILDAFLAIRLARLARSADSPRWRRVYSLLAVTLGAGFFNDLHYSELPVPGVEGSWGVPGALLWSLQFVTLVLAARLRHVRFDLEQRRAPQRRNAPRLAEIRERTLAIAVALPILHFALSAAGALDEVIQPARETALLVWLLLVATVAVVQHRLLEASRRSLEQDTDLLTSEIAERRELEARREEYLAELERKQRQIEARSEELERFTSTVSNQLSMPLATLEETFLVLEDRLAGKESGELEEILQRADSAAGELARLLDEFLLTPAAARTPR